MSATTRFRIGIDVGGTFTHAVALSAETLLLEANVKVPTTHHASNGVGEGVVHALEKLMKQRSITAEQIVSVAHSTTQATNSLLEGDVERVAVISVGSGFQGMLTRRAAKLGNIPLAPGKFLHTVSHHVDRGDSQYAEKLDSFVERCLSAKIQVFVVSGTFAVEDPSDEVAIASYLRTKGIAATATHEVTQLYGVKIRTRTTAINASILPKMIEVADHTEREIRKMGISAPFLIMRSDGGVMTVEEMRKKPILTLLSGPAAGIAAALRYLKISDGIFLEVGGTSTDISVIKNGRALTRSAMIGGNRTFLKTLDCRTLGVGGGSLPRISHKKVIDVGPRSAHIAQVKYAAFENPQSSKEHPVTMRTLQLKPGDPADYLVFDAGNERFTFSPTCAANALGLVPEGDCARATPEFSSTWGEILQRELGRELKDFSQELLNSSSHKISKTVKGLLKEYKMNPEWTLLMGGGGGASAIVPHLAQHLGMRFEIARDNDVLSAIGVALGLIREVIERSVLNPSREDIYQLRAEARDRVLQQGASPETIEVFIEIDTKKNIIRAEAQGAIEFKSEKSRESSESTAHESHSLEQIQKLLSLKSAPSLRATHRSKRLTAQTYQLPPRSRLKRLMKSAPDQVTLVYDSRGVIRLKIAQAEAVETQASNLVDSLKKNLDRFTTYSDGGIHYPYLFVLLGDRIIDLTKLHAVEHFTSVLEMEAKEVPALEPAVILFTRHSPEEQES